MNKTDRFWLRQQFLCRVKHLVAQTSQFIHLNFTGRGLGWDCQQYRFSGSSIIQSTHFQRNSKLFDCNLDKNGVYRRMNLSPKAAVFYEILNELLQRICEWFLRSCNTWAFSQAQGQEWSKLTEYNRYITLVKEPVSFTRFCPKVQSSLSYHNYWYFSSAENGHNLGSWLLICQLQK